MYRLRLFAIRHSRAFEVAYQALEKCMILLDPVFSRIGYQRVETPVALLENGVKSLLFDCKMCGQCVLSSTGMSCPMNCPKELRNGPCGGVRPGGFCEVKPKMKCVWALAWDGASRMKYGDRISVVLPPVERNLKGTSSWLRVSREKAEKQRAERNARKEALATSFPEARKIEPAAVPLAADQEGKSGT